MDYFCKKLNKKLNFNECEDCIYYEATKKHLKIPEHLNIQKIIYIKMINCKNLQPPELTDSFHIKNSITKFSRTNFDETEFEEKKLFYYWDKIVGEFISKNTQLQKIKHGTVYIKPINQAFAQDLFFLKEIILENIQKSLKNKKIIELKFI